jgi:hypothetical protein
MSDIEHRPTWYVLFCPQCGKQRDLFCHDHGTPVKVGAVEVVPADDRERAVDEAAERIFASGILDEIAASNDGDGRDAMQDAVTIAHLAFGGQ